MDDIQKITTKAEQIVEDRLRYFPDIKDDDLWGNDKKKKGGGFSMVPRTMPIIGQIMDDLSVGKPTSSTFLALWCRDFYNTKYLVIKDPNIYALESGFSKNRKEATWKTRMRILKKMGFIDSKEGFYGEFSHVVILHPHIVIKALFDHNKIQDTYKYEHLVARAKEVGAEEAKKIFG